MNKKGEIGQIGAIMLFIVFLIMWFVWLGKWVADLGYRVVEANSLTGVEAFAFSNLNFIIFICMILGMMAWTYMSSG